MSASTAGRPQPPASGQLPTRTFHVHTWRVEINLFETGEETSARAVLMGDSPDTVVAIGTARHIPSEGVAPEIGDEVAASQALHALADELLRTAVDDLAALDRPPRPASGHRRVSGISTAPPGSTL